METGHEIWNLECEEPVYVRATEDSGQQIGVNIKMDFKKQHLKQDFSPWKDYNLQKTESGSNEANYHLPCGC